MNPRGCTRPISMTTEKVLAAIARIETEEFTIGNIFALELTLKRGSIDNVLMPRVKDGILTKIGRGRYRKGGLKIRPHALPVGIVAEAVWVALSTDPERLFMRSAEVVGEAETYLGRVGVDLRKSVYPVLTRWHRDGYLERRGPRRWYEYRLKDGVTERPPVMCP